MTLSGVIITEKSYESSDGRVRKIRYFDKPWFQIASIVWLAASNVKWISHNFKILRKYNVNIICTLKNSFLKKKNIILIFPTISKQAPNLTNSLFLHLFQNSPESIQRQGNSKESHYHATTDFFSSGTGRREFANKGNSVFVARLRSV